MAVCKQFYLWLLLLILGDGNNTLFWGDRWILGQRIEDLAPLISTMIPKRIANKRTVAEALADMRWVRDIHGIASVDVIIEFLSLWDIISEVVLYTFGACRVLVSTRRNLHMMLCSRDPYPLVHGRESGNLGHPVNAGSFYG